MKALLGDAVIVAPAALMVMAAILIHTSNANSHGTFLFIRVVVECEDEGKGRTLLPSVGLGPPCPHVMPMRTEDMDRHTFSPCSDHIINRYDRRYQTSTHLHRLPHSSQSTCQAMRYFGPRDPEHVARPVYPSRTFSHSLSFISS
jgi:hypothetical protein